MPTDKLWAELTGAAVAAGVTAAAAGGDATTLFRSERPSCSMKERSPASSADEIAGAIDDGG